jgi:hypothetical protein
MAAMRTGLEGEEALTLPPTGGSAGRVGYCHRGVDHAAGRYARRRATVRWRGGGDRHEAICSNRGAGRAAEHARRGGDGLPGPRTGPQVGALPVRARDRDRILPVRRVHRFSGQQRIPEGTQVPARGATILLLNGSLRISFTNVDTGKTITENVTGSGKAIVNPDNSLSIRQEGHLGLITLEAADAERFGLPPLGVIGGVLHEEIAPDGTFTLVSLQGHVLVDVCAALS